MENEGNYKTLESTLKSIDPLKSIFKIFLTLLSPKNNNSIMISNAVMSLCQVNNDDLKILL